MRFFAPDAAVVVSLMDFLAVSEKKMQNNVFLCEKTVEIEGKV